MESKRSVAAVHMHLQRSCSSTDHRNPFHPRCCGQTYRQKCEGLISHVRRSYDTHRNLKREVMPCTCKSHVKHNEGVMSHVKRSHIIHAKELCDKDQKVVAHTQDARQAEGLLPRSCCAPLAVSKSPYEKKFLFFSFCIKTGRMSCLEAILLPRPTGMSVPSFISTHVDS